MPTVSEHHQPNKRQTFRTDTSRSVVVSRCETNRNATSLQLTDSITKPIILKLN